MLLGFKSRYLIRFWCAYTTVLSEPFQPLRFGWSHPSYIVCDRQAIDILMDQIEFAIRTNTAVDEVCNMRVIEPGELRRSYRNFFGKGAISKGSPKILIAA